MSPAAEYAEEAAFYRTTLRNAARHPIETILELGSGGGNNASHMKQHYKEMVLVDKSPDMLAMSRILNPELEHYDGDMRTVRLGRQFDAVFVHDAVCYMTTETDLRQAMETAFIHCKPGGVAFFCPDYIRENFEAAAEHGGEDADGRGMRWLSWQWQRDPGETTYFVDYAYLLRDSDGRCAPSTTATLKDSFHARRGCDYSRTSGSHIRSFRSNIPIWSLANTRCLCVGNHERINRSRELPQDEALQVIRLRHAEHDRVIPSLHPLLHHTDVHSRVERRVEDEFPEHPFVDVIGATARDEKPAGLQQLERAQVDFLVTRERLRDRGLALRECRRVEHDASRMSPPCARASATRRTRSSSAT